MLAVSSAGGKAQGGNVMQIDSSTCIEARNVSVRFPVKTPFHLKRKPGEQHKEFLTAVNNVSLSIES